MEIIEQRTVLTYTCDGRVDGMPAILSAITLLPRTKPAARINPDRYRVSFWGSSYLRTSQGCRIEVVGHRLLRDGTIGSRIGTRTWDLSEGVYEPELPDWLRLIVDGDLHALLPRWAQQLWQANSYSHEPGQCHGTTCHEAGWHDATK